MTIENWINILAPIIGVLVTVVSATLTYIFAKKQQIEIEERRLKEKYYLDYIEAVSKLAISRNSMDETIKLADTLNQLLLVGSAKVVVAAMDFHDYLQYPKENFSRKTHDELLTKLLKSMRKDLYKNSKVNEGYPIIHLNAAGLEKS